MTNEHMHPYIQFMDVVANLALNDSFRLKILIKIFTSVKKKYKMAAS